MNGISAIIAIVLILMIVVAMASLTYVFSSEIFTTTTSSTEKTINQTTKSLLTNMKIEDVEGNRIFIRNVGQSDLTELSVYINDEPAHFNFTSSVIKPGVLGIIEIYDFIKEDDEIKITTAQGASSTKKAPDPCKETVLCLKFDENSETITRDSSPYGNDCTIYGATLVTDCFSDSCLSFDGINDYLNCGNDTSLNIGTGDFSISAWVNVKSTDMNDIASKPPGAVTSFIKGYKMTTGTYYEEELELEGTMIAVGTGGQWYINYQGAQMPFNEWHNVVWVLKRGEGSFIYVDGVLNSNKTVSNYQDISNNENLTIGGLSSPFNGIIDEVRIYNKAIY